MTRQNKLIFRYNRVVAGTAENDHIALAEHLIPILEFHRRKHVGKFFGIRKRLAARINLRRVLLHVLEHQ